MIQYGIWIVSEKWVGKGLPIIGRCRQTLTKPPGTAVLGQLHCAVYVICGRLESPLVAIVAMNPLSLWTPLLWGWGSTTRSCTICTFTLNLQWRQPQSSTWEAVYGDPRSTGICFLGLAEKEERPPEKCVEFRHWHWHWLIHDYSSIRHLTTVHEHLHFNSNDDQLFHFVCGAEVNIAMEKSLQCRCATYNRLCQFWCDTNTYSTPLPSATEQLATINTSTSFVERKSTLRWRNGSNFNTDRYTFALVHTHSTTRSSATGQLLMSTCVSKETTIDSSRACVQRNQHPRGEVSPISTATAQPMIGTERLRKRIEWCSSRTVCHLRRSGWLEVMAVEADSTIDYWA